MPTWKELSDQVLEEIGSTGAVVPITLAGNLSRLSEAQHQLQTKTGVVRRSFEIQISELDSSGTKPIPRFMRTVSEAAYLLPSSFIASKRVLVISPELYRRYLRQHEAGELRGQSDIAVAIINNKINVINFAGLTGSIVLHYEPTLQPFYPSDVINWPGYGLNPGAKMAIEGPEQEFDSAIEGIKGYACLKLIHKVPQAKQLFREEMLMWDREWAEAAGNLMRDAPSYASSTDSPNEGWFTGVR